MIDATHVRPRLASLVIGLLLVIVSPALALAHTELETATPAHGSTVTAPFDGPIRLTFSEELGAGSKADLLDDGGDEIASATVDGPDATMTFALDAPLGPGEYEVAWTGIAVDGHVERGTVSFTVAPAPPTPEPTPSPSPSPVPTASAEPATPSPEPTPSAGPSPSATSTDSTAAGGDMVLPIIVALVVAVGGGAYLLSRRDRSSV